ncbi:sensor histidine kinase [Rhodobacterales bacterium HKCCE3408]|nr:sensor histidine kinase [Rhodobacterales bacterium HKCCE3408]
MTLRQTPASFRRSATIAGLGVVLAGILILTVALPRLERAFLTRTADDGLATLALTLEVLRSELDRAEPLPALLADRPILTELLRDPDNSGLIPYTNEQLRQTALALGVSDIYLMDRDGTTIAASNYRRETSFVGQNFAYRPYFRQALGGGTGRFHALGTTSGQRGYFFAAPVLDGTDVAGVIAVKVTLDRLEATWTDNAASVIVADSSNVIFLSDRPDWHFRTLGPVGPALDGILATRQYPPERLRPLDVERRVLTSSAEIWDVAGTDSFVGVTGLVAAAGWRVSVLLPTGPATAQARQAAALIFLGVLILALLAALLQQRRARLLERISAQAEAQATLEARVAERTEELRQEIEERRAAEDRLRTTQKELIQAGKLAALGQMSAALSHEFNQPLAAVKAYADNAGTFLDRGQEAEARRNIGLISQMADRMASISKHLRNFARRPQDKTGPIPLLATIDDAVELMRPRMQAAHATLSYARPEAEIWVTGGRVRLQQVLVNLISNALDAMERQAEPRMELSVSQTVDGWRVSLRDHGPGLSGDAAQVFDPFFSTKDPGKGLGLGLSISYNIMRDFGGALSAATHPDGGAVFSADLRAAAAPDGLAAE